MRKEEEKRVGASQRSSKGVLSGPRQTRGDNGALEAESEAESSVSGRPGRPALRGSPQAGPCQTSPLSWISQPPVACGERPVSSPRLGPPEITIKTKEVMRPPQGDRKSQAGEPSGTLFYQEELPGASLWLSGKNLPAHAGDTHLIPGPGGFHVTQSS